MVDSDGYKKYLTKMNERELTDETSLVIKQTFDKNHDENNFNSLMIQLCHNEWIDRNNKLGFIHSFNLAVNEIVV